MVQKLGCFRFVSCALILLLVGNFPTLAAEAAAGASRSPARATGRSVARRHSSIRYRYGVPTYADSTKEDVGGFDDPVVRQAAVQALGRYNGSVVAIDPNSGRVLTVVNQKLAFSAGFIPCSTIKPTIAQGIASAGHHQDRRCSTSRTCSCFDRLFMDARSS